MIQVVMRLGILYFSMRIKKKTTKKPCVPQDEKKADYYEKLCHESAHSPIRAYDHLPTPDGCLGIRDGTDPKSLDKGPTEYEY